MIIFYKIIRCINIRYCKNLQYEYKNNFIHSAILTYLYIFGFISRFSEVKLGILYLNRNRSADRVQLSEVEVMNLNPFYTRKNDSL